MIGEGSKVPEQVEGMGSSEVEVQCAIRGATEPGGGILSTGEGWLQSGAHGMPRDSRGYKGRQRSPPHYFSLLHALSQGRSVGWRPVASE